jgi:hypothetical protein
VFWNESLGVGKLALFHSPNFTRLGWWSGSGRTCGCNSRWTSNRECKKCYVATHPRRSRLSAVRHLVWTVSHIKNLHFMGAFDLQMASTQAN